MFELVRHPYKYFPYELELAKREAQALFPRAQLTETNRGIRLGGDLDPAVADRLVYFGKAIEGDKILPTRQSRIERAKSKGGNRQSTRYSAHGLHEYKGKFNPQVVGAILNMFGVSVGSRVVDPFCGSGTSLLESTHFGMNAVGMDINPLAVFIANAKLAALSIPASEFRRRLGEVVAPRRSTKVHNKIRDTEREEYLLSWFTTGVFDEIERVRYGIEALGEPYSSPFLAIASDLLRGYSLQDPQDLRIRRRKTPLPDKPFTTAFEEAAALFLDRLEPAQEVAGVSEVTGRAMLIDSREVAPEDVGDGVKFDCALTSPPYATALPYIDTQRLSLVWLSLVSPRDVLPLEARLVGSREIRGGQSKRILLSQLQSNADGLPTGQATFCQELQNALGNGDGFRRQAVPVLLYRYFVGMAQAFRSLRPLMEDRAPFALIVGGNHTVLGGNRFDIDTPRHLVEIAESCGWTQSEVIPLQTYQRYGYHTANAVVTEAMVLLTAS